MSRRTIWVSSYSAEHEGAPGEGVYALELDTVTGELGPPRLVAPSPRPAWLAAHPSHDVLYVLDAHLDDGAVTAFRASPAGVPRRLEPLGTWATGGGEPCHALVVEGRGRRDTLVVSNYGGTGAGSLARFDLDDDGLPAGPPQLSRWTGSGPVAGRQERSHPHSGLVVDGVLLVADLGADVVRVESPDPAGTAGAPVVLPPGTGPRHMAQGPGGTVHVVGELAGTIAVLQRGAGGTFRLAGVAPATAGSWSPGDLVAHIAVPAGTDGEHVYVSCRGADTLTVHAASPADGLLRALHDVPLPGACPRHFAVTDGFALVGHQASGSVSSLRLGAPGPPAPVTTVGGVPHPACLLPGGFS